MYKHVYAFRAFSLLMGFHEGAFSGVFVGENAH